MSGEFSSPVAEPRPANRVTACCAAGAGAIAAVVLVSWAAGSEAGMELWLGAGRMSPLGAAGLAGLALALWLRREEGRNARAGALLAGAVGLISLEQLAIHVRAALTGQAPRAESSLLGAVLAMALAGAVLGLDHRSRNGRRPTHALAVLAGLLAIAVCLGHLYQTEAFFRLGVGKAMPPHAAVGAGMVALGVLMSRRGPGALQVLTSAGPGGALARRLLPWVVLLPPALEALRLWLVRSTRLGAETGQVLQAVAVILLIGGFLWRTAARANEVDAVRRESEEALRRAHAELERRVRERTAELELISSRLQAAMEVAALGVWDWFPQTQTLTWDATLRKLYGVGPDEPITYDTWFRLLVDEERDSANARVLAAIEAQETYHGVFRIRRRDGATRVIESQAVLKRGADGAVERMIGVNRDITEARAAEERLRESEALLSEFVRHVPAAIAMFDRDMRYLRVSERWKTDFGLGEGELAGRGHYDVFPHMPAHWPEVHRRVLAGAVERADEEAFPRPGAPTEWVQWEARPWLGADGAPAGMLLFAQLITARKRLELDLERQRAELQRSNRDLEQFAYVASHDLQEPLRAVAGCVQLLQRRHGPKLDAAANELIEHSVAGARRMQALILDLLTFSRVGTGEMATRPVCLSEPLDEALGNLRAAIAESGAEVTRDDPLPTLEIDRERVAMLLQNLVGNSLKYRAPGRAPRVHVGAELRPEGWVLSVRDNGIGIEPRFFERIFVIFQRLHTRSEYTGTGIGLALCKKIVERHGGRIWVESTPGEGAVFRFTLSAPPTP